jgi:hypothetical protein
LSFSVFCALWGPFQSDDVELRQTMPLTLDREGSSDYTIFMSNIVAFVLGMIAFPLLASAVVFIINRVWRCSYCGQYHGL